MKNFLEKLKNQPEPVRKKIFIVAMAGIAVVVFSFYLFSIKDSIDNAMAKNAKEESGGLAGEFTLPSIKDSIGASLKDIFK